MHIAYLRQGAGINLDPNGRGSSFGGWTERYAFFRGAERRGHKITIYSPVNKREEHLLKKYPNVSYKPRADKIGRNIDVVYIEHGADNYTYGSGGWLLPNIPFMHYLLKSYEGLVFYNMSDIALRPALCPEAYPVKATYKYLSAASMVDLFRNKGWVILGKYQDLEGRPPDDIDAERRFEVCASTDRSPVGTLGLPMSSFSLGCFLEEFVREPSKEVIHDLIYSGNERGRKAILKDWYGNLPEDIDVALYGSWSNPEELEELGIRCMGQIPNKLLRGFLKHCLAQVYITDKKYIRVGALVTRFYEVISSGSTMWFPKELAFLTGDKWDDLYVLKNKAHLVKVLRTLQEMTWAERVEINSDQIELISADTPESRMREFEVLVEKYWDEPDEQFDKTFPQIVKHIEYITVSQPYYLNEGTKGPTRCERRQVLEGNYNFKKCKLIKPIDIGVDDSAEKYEWFKEGRHE